MNCESNGKPLCENGWQTRFVVDKLVREICPICRPVAHASWAKNWKCPKQEEEESKNNGRR